MSSATVPSLLQTHGPCLVCVTAVINYRRGLWVSRIDLCSRPVLISKHKHAEKPSMGFTCSSLCSLQGRELTLPSLTLEEKKWKNVSVAMKVLLLQPLTTNIYLKFRQSLFVVSQADCPLSKCLKTTFVYFQVTKPSSDHRSYDSCLSGPREEVAVVDVVVEPQSPQREEVGMDGWVN